MLKQIYRHKYVRYYSTLKTKFHGLNVSPSLAKIVGPRLTKDDISSMQEGRIGVFKNLPLHCVRNDVKRYFQKMYKVDLTSEDIIPKYTINYNNIEFTNTFFVKFRSKEDAEKSIEKFQITNLKVGQQVCVQADIEDFGWTIYNLKMILGMVSAERASRSLLILLSNTPNHKPLENRFTLQNQLKINGPYIHYLVDMKDRTTRPIVLTLDSEEEAHRIIRHSNRIFNGEEFTIELFK